MATTIGWLCTAGELELDHHPTYSHFHCNPVQVMAVDSSPTPDSHLLASVSYDRTVKLWAPEEGVEAGVPGGQEAMEL